MPRSRTLSPSVRTAPSTQPPDTEPTTSLSSLTAIAAPGSRGPDPSVPTTRARATPLPASRHRAISSSSSFTLPSSPGPTPLPRDHLCQRPEGVQRMPLHELVNEREGRRHPGRQRSVTWRRFEWVYPHRPVGDPLQPLHLLGQQGRVAPVPAVGEDHDHRAAGHTPYAPLVVELSHPLPQAGAARPVWHRTGGLGQGGVRVAGRQLAGDAGQAGAEGEG